MEIERERYCRKRRDREMEMGKEREGERERERERERGCAGALSALNSPTRFFLKNFKFFLKKKTASKFLLAFIRVGGALNLKLSSTNLTSNKC